MTSSADEDGGASTAPEQAARSRNRYDALAYLPCSSILACRKSQTIYDGDQAPSHVYLVIDGRVKVSRTTDDGSQIVVAICLPDEFFGESAFLSLPKRSEQATALETTKLMSWSAFEVEALILTRPRLGMALIQNVSERVLDLAHRIESFSVDNIGRRLARSLVRMAERRGGLEEDGMVGMLPLTHELLSQYVGTSREIVTHYMSRLRKQGYVRYSRKGIHVHPEKLKEWLGREESRDYR